MTKKISKFKHLKADTPEYNTAGFIVVRCSAFYHIILDKFGDKKLQR